MIDANTANKDGTSQYGVKDSSAQAAEDGEVEDDDLVSSTFPEVVNAEARDSSEQLLLVSVVWRPSALCWVLINVTISLLSRNMSV